MHQLCEALTGQALDGLQVKLHIRHCDLLARYDFRSVIVS